MPEKSNGINRTLASAYIQLLERGMQILRESCELGHPDWTKIEVEHLHNIPSLIQEGNRLRHDYYYRIERPSYLGAIEQSGHERLVGLVKIFYREPWNTIATVLDSL